MEFAFLPSLETRKPVKQFDGLSNNPLNTSKDACIQWQGRRASNPQPSVLETDTLPIELRPYVLKINLIY